MEGQNIVYLHGEADRTKNGARIKRALTILAIGTLIVVGLIVALLIWRDATHMNNANETPSQMLIIAVTLVWGALLIFFSGMKVSPLLHYRRYLREIHGGLSREVSGMLVRFEEDTTFRDGLSFYAMVVTIGDGNEPEDERLLYWDARLARPGVAVGDQVRIQAHGNDIIGFENKG